MDADWIIAAFLVIDTGLECLEHRCHAVAQVPDADSLTVVVVAVKFFQTHHERFLYVLRVSGYLSGTLSVSRFNCRGLALPHTRSTERPPAGPSCSRECTSGRTVAQ